MRILFDQGTPEPLRHHLTGHEVSTAYERGWSTLTNGQSIDAAEREGCEVFVTTDSSIKHQQDPTRRRFGTVVLLSTSWPRIQRAIGPIAVAVDAALPGTSEKWRFRRRNLYRSVAVQFVTTVIGGGATWSSTSTLTRNRRPSSATS